MAELQNWMDTLYGWAPSTMKPKLEQRSYVHHSGSHGFSALDRVGVVAHELHTGDIVQLESRATGGLLRVNSISGKVDFNGIYGKQSQFIIRSEVDGSITLRCVLNTSNFLILRNGILYANGKGDPQCRFKYRLAEGGSSYMKFECLHNPNRFISVHKKSNGNDDTRSVYSMRSLRSSGSGIEGQFRVVMVGRTPQCYAS
ncbi:uncharacterized protein LOC121407972 isoform X1 [Lytechinus variegatus]|uniref:uncharacterized protein LOC121407972 isoform X1 n=1 Tax=Lytechinus variegatus TaxID=7654 RepID=UPI001BB1A6CD|nr:uncharacterized protein LOC121407972 isoform X1 [Lytechinus variegatus]